MSQFNLHEILFLLDPHNILNKAPLLFMLNHIRDQPGERHSGLPHLGEICPYPFFNNNALYGIRGKDIMCGIGRNIFLALRQTIKITFPTPPVTGKGKSKQT